MWVQVPSPNSIKRCILIDKIFVDYKDNVFTLFILRDVNRVNFVIHLDEYTAKYLNTEFFMEDEEYKLLLDNNTNKEYIEILAKEFLVDLERLSERRLIMVKGG